MGKLDSSIEEMEISVADADPDVNEESVGQAKDYLISLGIDPDERELTPAQAVIKAKQLQEVGIKAAQVLSRGQTIDAMGQILDQVPSDRVGQFVRNRQMDIERYRMLGYRVEERQPDKENPSPHDSGDSKINLGDSILMSVDRDVHAVIHKNREKLKQPKIKAERKKFNLLNQNAGIPTIDTTKGDN